MHPVDGRGDRVSRLEVSQDRGLIRALPEPIARALEIGRAWHSIECLQPTLNWFDKYLEHKGDQVP